MEFLPEQNQFLEEVKSGDLKLNEEYLIEFTGYDNVNVK
jgi:hypothetical protein